MQQLSMIACVSRDGGLGNQGELLWHIPADLQFFRQTTTGHTVVMGGATYRSIGRPLPKRRNVVLSREPIGNPEVLWLKNRTELDQFLAGQATETFIIGGASLYRMFIDQAEQLYLTEVDGERPADVFFPKFNQADFTMQVLQDGQFEGVDYQIKLYRRRKS